MPITPREKRERTANGGLLTKWWVTRHGAAKLSGPKWRKMKSEIAVTRTGGAGEKAFEACVDLAAGGKRWRGFDAKKRASGFTHTCQFGRNPRVALARAFAKVARVLTPGKGTAHRRGAFARYR